MSTASGVSDRLLPMMPSSWMGGETSSSRANSTLLVGAGMGGFLMPVYEGAKYSRGGGAAIAEV